MTIDLKPEIVAGLAAVAATHGLSVEDYLKELIESELPLPMPDMRAPDAGSGMIWEDGLLIYGAGTPLPVGFLDDAIRRSREERSRHILGSHS
jgi:hypothetical protein